MKTTTLDEDIQSAIDLTVSLENAAATKEQVVAIRTALQEALKHINRLEAFTVFVQKDKLEALVMDFGNKAYDAGIATNEYGQANAAIEASLEMDIAHVKLIKAITGRGLQ